MISPAVALCAICLVGAALYASAWVLCVGWLAWNRRRDTPRVRSGVSILKPLCGADDDLEENLASFLALDHEPLQIIFGAADPDDPALAIARRLAARRPDRDVVIATGANDDAANPKIGLLERLLPHARHPVVLLSDSNVRVTADEVARVLPAFADPRVGMVYQAVVGIGEESLAAAAENLHYTEWAGMIAIGTTILTGEHVVNAKGQWVRRRALADVGDFVQVRDSAADDYQLSQAFLAAGWRLALSPHRVHIVHREWSWTGLVQRHLRHAGLRRRICPWAYPLELLLNPVTWSLALLAAGRPALALPLVAGKVVLELSAARLLRGRPLAWGFAALVPLKDLVYFGGWFGSFAVSTVSWRGRAYTLGRKARLVPCAVEDCPAGELPATIPLPVRPAPHRRAA